MATGTRFIGVTDDYRSLFAEDNPQLAAFDTLEDTYSASNVALIAVAPGAGSVFTREALGAIEELTEAAWRAPYSTRVDSLTNYSHSEALGDDLVVEPLVYDAQSLSDADVARIEVVAFNATELAGRLVSHDGRIGGLAITFALPENPDPAVVEITDYLAALLETARASYPDIAYYLTGDVVMNRTFADATKDDLETLSPIMFLIIAITTAVLLRSAFGTLAILLVLAFVISTAMGFAGWLGTVFNPANSGVPIIVMTVAVAHTVHIAADTLMGMSHGLDKKEAVAESLRINAWPVFLTTVTTVIGFLSLNASDSPPFQVLSNLVAFGVLCAFVYSMTLLPALLSIPATACASRPRRTTWLLRPLRRLRRRAPHDPARILHYSGRRPGHWHSPHRADRQLDKALGRNLRVPARYGLRDRKPDRAWKRWNTRWTRAQEGGITDPGYLRKVDAFAEWYREQPEVTHVQTFPDIMKRLNKNMHGDDPAFNRLPDDPELAAQYLLLYELSLPFGLDLNNRIDIAKSATRMTVVLRSLTSQAQREIDARAQVWLRSNSPDLTTEASGVSIVFAHLSQRNIESMLRGTIIAMALISLILVLVFKSARLGLVSLVPNFIPAAMSFGLWGYLVGHVVFRPRWSPRWPSGSSWTTRSIS